MRVLVADDNRMERRLLEGSIIKWGYEVALARDGVEAYQALTSNDPPLLALLDWEMPGMDGLEVCRAIRALNREPYVYLILITGHDRRTDIVKGMAAGADDYLVKPCHPAELEMRLRAGRRITELQSELIDARESLRYKASHDPLTGLANRASVLEALDRELARAEREAQSVAILLADLDHFKRVNDMHGHAAGDAVLVEVAARLSASARPYDMVGRYGGEEFLIVTAGCDLAEGLDVAERLRRAVGASPIVVGGLSLIVSGSFGVAACTPGRCLPSHVLLSEADAAMYHAKARGGNCSAVAEAPSEPPDASCSWALTG